MWSFDQALQGKKKKSQECPLSSVVPPNHFVLRPITVAQPGERMLPWGEVGERPGLVPSQGVPTAARVPDPAREGGHDITPQHLQGQAGGRPNNGLSFRGRGAFRGLGALPSPSGPPSRCSRTPPSSGTGRLPEQGGGFPGRGAQGPGLEARSEHGPGPLSPLVSQGGPQHRRFRHHHPDQVDLGRSLAGGSAAGGRGRGGRGAGPQGWALKEPTLVGGRPEPRGCRGRSASAGAEQQRRPPVPFPC